MKRIFAAIDISDDARRKAAAHIESLRRQFPQIRVGWEKPEKMHLTLKFLGDTENKELEELKVIVEDISKNIADFKLRISNTGVFPNARNPRILWLDVIDDQGILGKINNLLEAECVKIGFQRGKRKFLPHLTIGRVREPHKAFALANSHLETAFEPIGFEVSEIVIYESILHPNGSNFQKVKSFKLV